MPPSPSSTPDAEPADGGAPRTPRAWTILFRAGCFVLGLALVVTAVWAIASQHEKLVAAWDAARNAHPGLLFLSLALPVVNWVLTAGTIWLLTSRYGRIPFREMLLLIGSAWLLNLLPLRLGMVGRVAFHKKYHAIRVRDCGIVLLQALLCSVIALSTLILLVFLVVSRKDTVNSGLNPSWPVLLLIVAGIPAVIFTCATLVARRVMDAAPHSWRWPAAILLRYFDMIVWFTRYALVFVVIGHPLPPMNAAVITISAQAAMLTPVQFGLREWTVGAVSAMLEPKLRQPDSSEPTSAKELLNDAATGLMADVVMRGAELVIVLPLGLASSWWVWRRVRQSLPSQNARTPVGK